MTSYVIPRFTLDTDVVVAAMRSPRGASAAIIRAARRHQVELVVTVALALEYEAVCRRPQLRDAAADEMVSEASVNGCADVLVTFNKRDYGSAPARFGIDLLRPREALERIQR